MSGATQRSVRGGVLSAALAYVLWGLFPLYFKQLAGISPLDVLVHRVVWSLVFLLGVLAVRRQWTWLRDVLRQPKVLGAFAVSALLLSANWLTYIWAVTHDHVIDASLGYFITPLVNVLLGYTVLHERLRAPQWSAVALAAGGVLWLAVHGGQLPWIALVLACTFGGYGLMRQGRAVLIGTRSVEKSEKLSQRLATAGIEHQVLNARQHEQEAKIVEQAGQPGRHRPGHCDSLAAVRHRRAAHTAGHAGAAAVPRAKHSVRARRVAVPRGVHVGALGGLLPDLGRARHLQRRRLARQQPATRRGAGTGLRARQPKRTA